MKELVSIEYKIWIESLKNKFRSSQIKASIRVNTTLLEFYWDLGEQIVQKQEEHKWGSGFLEKLYYPKTTRQLFSNLNSFPDLLPYETYKLQLPPLTTRFSSDSSPIFS